MSDNDYNPFTDGETTPEQSNEAEVKSKVPPDYLKVKLCTQGKLNAPATVHVRDYSGRDALQLSMMNEENVIDTITAVADSIVWEGVDSDYLHEQELQEILLNIYLNYWGSSIPDYPYPWEEEELQELEKNNSTRVDNIREGREVPRIEVPLTGIETKPLPEEFKEPFTLTDKSSGFKVTFSLGRIGHIKNAQRYIEKKYAYDDQRFGPIRQKIRSKGEEKAMQEISSEELREYQRYIEQRALDFAQAQQSQVIKKVGSKKMENLDQQFKAYHDIGLHMWKMYSSFIEKLDFGVTPDVQVQSPITGQLVTRRFEFRLMDFIPSVESQDTDGYDVSYEE